MTGDPQVGDVLEYKDLLCVIVAERDAPTRREVLALWLNEPEDEYDGGVSWHIGYEKNWKKWVKLCGSD